MTVKNTATRSSKKQQYLNSLEFDLNAMQEIIDGDKWVGMYQGDFVSKSKAKREKIEIQKEIDKVKNDKSYKPWKDF
jgi:hypothetical protein